MSSPTGNPERLGQESLHSALRAVLAAVARHLWTPNHIAVQFSGEQLNLCSCANPFAEGSPERTDIFVRGPARRQQKHCVILGTG